MPSTEPEAPESKALAVPPRRARGRARFESVIDGAEQLLGEVGLQGFSIPALAEHLGYTRTSIYRFFPTPYAVLNELTRRYLARLTEVLQHRATQLPQAEWRGAITDMVLTAAGFHNAHPIARMLILGGAVTDDSFRATEITISELGGLTDLVMQPFGITLPTSDPEAGAVAVELGTAVFRISNFRHGRITPAYADEAAHAMTAYLARYADPA